MLDNTLSGQFPPPSLNSGISSNRTYDYPLETTPFTLKNGTHHHTENRFDDASFSLQCNNNNDTYKVWVNSFDFLDSPSTTTTCTYKLHILADASSRQSTVNRSVTNPSDGYNTPGNTTMTLMEIAQ